MTHAERTPQVTIVAWIYNTFENNYGNNDYFIKYFMGVSGMRFAEHFTLKCFQKENLSERYEQNKSNLFVRFGHKEVILLHRPEDSLGQKPSIRHSCTSTKRIQRFPYIQHQREFGFPFTVTFSAILRRSHDKQVVRHGGNWRTR